MSWREFRYNIRSISLLAVGGVAFTTVAVAAVVHFLLAWDWAVGFVLGAIISPPDEVAPMADCAASRAAAPHHGGSGRRGPRQ